VIGIQRRDCSIEARPAASSPEAMPAALLLQEVGAQCGQSGNCNGGCPYKTMEEGQLRAALSKLDVRDR
jgi:flavoprotein